MRALMIPLAAIATMSAVPAAAQYYDNGYSAVQYRDRDYVDRQELRRDQREVRQQQREYYDALRNGDRREIREERRDVVRAGREYRRDARDWQRGRNYSWNRPDPRYNGYYADNYYRRSDRPYYLSRDDRVYRGRDGRYYCRRNDGTTGLIVGGLGGGVLGNIIAPGGSKTLGTIIGGGLGAVLGNSIERGNNRVECR